MSSPPPHISSKSSCRDQRKGPRVTEVCTPFGRTCNERKVAPGGRADGGTSWMDIRSNIVVPKSTFESYVRMGRRYVSPVVGPASGRRRYLSWVANRRPGPASLVHDPNAWKDNRIARGRTRSL